MLLQYPLAEWINLYLPPALHSGSFQPKIQTADPGEQRTEGQMWEFLMVSSTHIDLL